MRTHVVRYWKLTCNDNPNLMISEWKCAQWTDILEIYNQLARVECHAIRTNSMYAIATAADEEIF